MNDNNAHAATIAETRYPFFIRMILVSFDWLEILAPENFRSKTKYRLYIQCQTVLISLIGQRNLGFTRFILTYYNITQMSLHKMLTSNINKNLCIDYVG